MLFKLRLVLAVYKRLSVSQKYICNLIQDYDNFVDQVRDKYLSICKTVLKRSVWRLCE